MVTHTVVTQEGDEQQEPEIHIEWKLVTCRDGKSLELFARNPGQPWKGVLYLGTGHSEGKGFTKHVTCVKGLKALPDGDWDIS